MKKLVLSSILMLTLSISFVSCKEAADKAKEATEAAGDMADDAADTAKDMGEKAMEEAGDMADKVMDGLPSFDSAEVADYVKTYNDYYEEYKTAVESKDMTAFSKLGAKGQELATKAQEVMKNLSAEDASKLTEFMTAKSKEIQDLAAKMMQ